jgi:hypothetical protein
LAIDRNSKDTMAIVVIVNVTLVTKLSHGNCFLALFLRPPAADYWMG